MTICYFFFFFFFQAEDGIRDVAVTGVQTCALPISADGVVVEKDLVDRERDVVLGFELHHVVHFLGRDLRDLHLLDDQFPTTDRDRALRGLDARLGNRALDRLDDGARILDGAVRDRVRGQRGRAERGKLVGSSDLAQLESLHRARSDVEGENVRGPAAERHVKHAFSLVNKQYRRHNRTGQYFPTH